jgi:cell division protein FtsI (penicillin-binding protein 3)
VLGHRGRMNLRLMALAAIFIAGGVVTTVRVAYVQLVRTEHYQNEAREEHFGQQEIRAPRGAILDRNGFPLATTVDAFDVFIDPDVWEDTLAARKAAEVIAPVIGRQPSDLINLVRAHEDGLYLASQGLDFD